MERQFLRDQFKLRHDIDTNPGEPECETCGGLLEEDDTLDIEEWYGYVSCRKVGHCSHCGNSYQWTEHYAYFGFTKPTLESREK